MPIGYKSAIIENWKWKWKWGICQRDNNPTKEQKTVYIYAFYRQHGTQN